MIQTETKNKEQKILDTVYNNFKTEAELFFVTKFLDGKAVSTEYKNCLDIIFNVTKTLDSNRGIIAFNKDYGQGKSFFFDVVNHRFRRTKGKNLYKKITAKEICALYTGAPKGIDPVKVLDELVKVKNLFIDDIGDEGEKKIFHHYSNSLNVLRYVILKRYELWVEKGWKLYGTTNLSIDQIASNYDGRVSDRLLQMCYFREFKFLKSGSFRQINSTRMLTEEERKANYRKFEKPKEVEKVDLEKYYNELINESEEELKKRDLIFWSFAKEYLMKKDLLSKSDFNKIDEARMDMARILLKTDLNKSTRQRMKHAGRSIKKAEIGRVIAGIKNVDVWNTAENIIAKEKFLQLKSNGHKF